MNLGLDMDGVLYKWHSAIYDYFRFYKNYTGTYRKFWEEDITNISNEMWDYLINVDIFYSSQQPTKDCTDFLDNVKLRFDLYYITNRPIFVKTTTEQFLRKYKFPFRDNLIFTDNKVNEARRLRLDYFLEDKPDNINSLSRVTNVIIIAQPWNKGLWEKFPTSKTLVGTLKYLEN